jgi:acyl-CoA thioesterase FadM
MNLIFRLLYVLLSSFRAPRLGPLEESVVRFRVLPNDLDTNLHMNNGRYLTLMDLGRVDLMLRMGVVGALRRNRWAPVVASLTVRYRRALSPFQAFELRTRLVGWDERWFFVEQRFTRGGELVAYALVKGQFLGPEGRVAPQQVVDASPYDIPSPPLSPAVRAWQEAEDRLVAATPALKEHELAGR